MKVLVTGGLGLVGRSVVRRLAERGYEVRVIDRQGGECMEGVECLPCDITDFAAVREQVRGQQAIIHLAAIPHPAGASAAEIFRINCTGTFNVYEAAAAEGIRRLATASSINWLGYFYGVKDFPIQYFPIDEEHPGIATDAYSLSKQVTEDIAAYYWRREGISSTCLRMPAVIDPTDERFRRMKEFFPRSLAMYNEWAAMPEAERSARLSQLLEKHSGWRAERWLEIPQEERQHLGLDFTNPDVRLVFSRANFWAMIDSRDAAQAFEKSLLAEFEGCHPLFVNDSHNSLGVETEELLRTFFPQVTARKRPLAGSEALVSIDRAREIIGFEPEHSFAASQDQNIAPA